jgi:hypothetical protein
LDWQRRTETQRLRDGGIWHALLDAETALAITAGHGAVLFECYVDAGHLATLANLNGGAPDVLFRDQILPVKPHLKSGDFGEILSRSVLSARGDRPTFPVYRWRNRMTRDDTVRGTDLIGYVAPGAEPSSDDVLVLCEVKTRSATVAEDVVSAALDGVQKDSVSRLANSLLFQQHALLRDGQPEGARRLARFANPHRFGSHKRRLVAAVVHEASTWDEGFLQHLPEVHGLDAEVEVVIVCVESLAPWIDAVHAAAAEHALIACPAPAVVAAEE